MQPVRSGRQLTVQFTDSTPTFSNALVNTDGAHRGRTDARTFRTADEQGAKLGKAVAKRERRHYFKPLHGDQGSDQQGGDDDD